MPQDKATPDPAFEALIGHIQQTRGLDFRGYKRSSLRRRIELRMHEVGVAGFAEYQDYLQGNPQEFAGLLDTVLINVTSFFRDPEAWAAVRDRVIPSLIQRADGRQAIRVWSVGCASGEEPFSVAMLMAEVLGTRAFCERVKIYATDLDESALRAARLATFAPRAVEHLDPALLQKYFEHTPAGYVFQRELRKCVIFGRHNLVFDAPISRIDLVICRNLMIYLEAETQLAALPRLHYALVDGGFLFLGKAETQLARSSLFVSVDTKHRIFARVAQRWRRPLGGGPSAESDARGGELLPRLLESMVDAATIGYLAVDATGALVFANAAARRLLEVREKDVGRLFHDLPISYRPADLRSCIEDVLDSGKPVRLEHQNFQRSGQPPLRLSIEVSPLLGTDRTPTAVLLGFSDTTRLFTLQTELHAAQESMETMIEELQSANEELETTNEELQSTNEELETTNEELQSTNEELETMNEELRSTNEEAEATNDELGRRSSEIAEFRAYAESVLRSVAAGLVVIDEGWTVRMWNRWVEKTWGILAQDAIGQRLLALDIGLPLGRLHERLHGVVSGAEAQSEGLLDGMDRRGRPVRCQVRIWPLTYDDRSRHGAVLMIEDVTDSPAGEAYADPLGAMTGAPPSEMCFLDPATLRFTLASRATEQRLGRSTQQLRQMALSDVTPHLPHAAMLALAAPLLAGERQEVVVETVIRSRHGREYPVEIGLQYYGQGEPPFLLAIVQDNIHRPPSPSPSPDLQSAGPAQTQSA